MRDQSHRLIMLTRCGGGPKTAEPRGQCLYAGKRLWIR